MAVDLIYKHQQKTYDLMRKELKRSKRAAYEFPTGCGKSFPGLKYMEDEPNKTVLIIVPSAHIREHWNKNIGRYLENGKERLKNKNIAIVTYKKVALLSKKVKNLKSDVIIIDELHRMGAETWEPAIDALIEKQPDVEVIAMTATPKRTDKRNMAQEKFGNNIVYEMSLTEALSGEKEGEVVLRSPRYVRVLSTLMPQIREYKEKIFDIEDDEKRQALLKKYERLETIISRSPDIQDIMVAGMQKKNGKYIVFCKDREDMIEKIAQVQEIFGKVNPKINTEYVISRNGKEDEFGKTTAQNRKTLERFESVESTDELQLLFCVDKLNEGVHIDGIDGEVLFDLTSSPVLYKQRIGRVTTPDKETVIVDAVNNWLTQIDTYREIEGAIKKGDSTRKNDDIDYSLLELLPEETELLEILREIGEAFKYNDNKTYEEIIKWLETHDGELPRARISKNGKALIRKEMTQEERNEVNLYQRWGKSKEKNILDEYVGRPLEEVPEEHREKIRILREYGLGLKEKTAYEEIIEWLKSHDGKVPRGEIGKKRNEMTEEEKNEVRLYARWMKSEERNVLERYVGISIEEVPEQYREKIKNLREYGLGLKEKTTYEEMIEWLDTHNAQIPRSKISQNRINLTRAEMTEDERREVNLYQRWGNSEEKRIMDEYARRPMEEVPEEYREKIRVLRGYGLGLEKDVYIQIIEWLELHNGELPKKISEKKRTGMTDEEITESQLYAKWIRSQERKVMKQYEEMPIEEVPEEYREKIRQLREYGLGITVYEQLIKWLETHDEKLPRGQIYQNGIRVARGKMTKEEMKEVNLYQRWRNSEEKRIMDEYAGRLMEEVPEEYREKIRQLRKYGLGITIYEQLIKWLEEHKGEMPRHINKKNITEEEIEERNLRCRWDYSKDKKILDEYAGRPIEEAPEEYREKIAKLRSLGQMGNKKDDKIKSRMKKSVGKQVGKNQETRQELEAIKLVEEQVDLLD